MSLLVTASLLCSHALRSRSPSPAGTQGMVSWCPSFARTRQVPPMNRRRCCRSSCDAAPIQVHVGIAAVRIAGAERPCGRISAAR